MAKVGRLIKELAVQELTATLTERSNFFVASIGPVKSADTDSFRKRLHASQASMVTVKRTLLIKSLAALKLDQAQTLVDGSMALILPGEDLIPAAKLLVDFAKSSEDKIAVRGAWVEGQLLDKKHFEQLASLPPKQQLLAELIAVLESPITGVVMTLESALGELVRVLEEAGKKAPAALAAPSPSAGDTSSLAGAGPAPQAPAATDQQQQQEGTTNG